MIPTLKPGEPLGDQPYAYVVGRRGHFLRKRTAIFEATALVAENPQFPAVEESFHLTVPKIPAVLFNRILGFLEAVNEERKTEAAILLMFENGAWDAVVPDQEATSTSVNYKIPDGLRPAGSVHSHPGMSAFFSGTDEADEAGFDGIHIVAADKGFLKPDLSVVAVVSGRRIELDAEDVIEGFGEGTDFPAEWLDRVKGGTGTNSLWGNREGLQAPREPWWGREMAP